MILIKLFLLFPTYSEEEPSSAGEQLDSNKITEWNGQEGSHLPKAFTTHDMIFNISFLLSYVSQFMTLLPGDIISTGTPFGVGLGLVPPRFLKAGDVVKLSIDELGVQKQTAVQFPILSNIIS